MEKKPIKGDSEEKKSEEKISINKNSEQNKDSGNSIGHAAVLGTESIPRLLVKFSVPAIIAMTINALYNVVDRIFIGNAPNLGAKGLAAITISFPSMIIILAIGLLIGQGGGIMYSLKLGEGDVEEAEKILGNSVFLSVVFGLFILVFGEVFLEKILIFSGASGNILPYGVEYLRIIFIGALFQIMALNLNNFLRSDGKPKMSMTSVAVGAISNVILDWLLIFVFKMGMKGAAIATATSQFISMAITLYQFTNRRADRHIKRKYIAFDTYRCKSILFLGTPGFLLQVAGSILMLVLNHSVIRYGGDLAVSGMGIVSSLQTLITLPIVGLNQGLKPILGFNFGAGKKDRVVKSAKIAVIGATVISIAGFIITQTIPSVLVSMFNSKPELVSFASMALRIWLLCLPIVGIQIIGSSFFQAIGKPKRSIFLSMLRQIIILIPSILIFSRIWGIKGILFAAPFADLTSTIVTATVFFRYIIRMKENIESKNLKAA